MNKKLTLSIDEKLIKFVHEIAKKSNQSISKIVSLYLETLKNKHSDDLNLSPKLKPLYGMFENSPLPDKSKMREMFHDKSNN